MRTLNLQTSAVCVYSACRVFCKLSNCTIREGVVMCGSHGVCIRLYTTSKSRPFPVAGGHSQGGLGSLDEPPICLNSRTPPGNVHEPRDHAIVEANLHCVHLMGTNNHWVLIFAWVLLFRKLVVTMLMGTIIYRVLVINGYLYSRLYGIHVQY